jgi:hypothetical protein
MNARLLFLVTLLACSAAPAQPSYLGDFNVGETVRCPWASFDTAADSATRATDGTVSVWKDGGTTQSVAGVTDTEDFDANAGFHYAAIDTSADAFYVGGAEYVVGVIGAVVDGQTINAPLCAFSLENRSDNRIVARGVADTGSTAGQIIFDSDVVAADGQYVGLKAWNVTQGFMAAIVASDDNTADTIDIFVPASFNGVSANNDVIYIVNDGPAVPIDLTNAEVNATKIAGVTVAAQAATNLNTHFNNGGGASSGTIGDVTQGVADTLSAIGSPSDAGSGATLSFNLSDTFARLGAPIGASLSADLQIVDGNVDDVETAVAALPTATEIRDAVLASCEFRSLSSYAFGEWVRVDDIVTYIDPDGAGTIEISVTLAGDNLSRGPVTIDCDGP